MTNQGTPGNPPGSAAELADFQRLQARLPALFRDVFPDPQAPRTVVILPSLSLDAEILAKVRGAHHYEERMLCLLLLLRLPRTRVIYLTSQPIPDAIIDYYLHLLPGIPTRHARDRLTLLACHPFVRTRKTRTGLEMFFSVCGPRSSKLASILFLTWS